MRVWTKDSSWVAFFAVIALHGEAVFVGQIPRYAPAPDGCCGSRPRCGGKRTGCRRGFWAPWNGRGWWPQTCFRRSPDPAASPAIPRRRSLPHSSEKDPRRPPASTKASACGRVARWPERVRDRGGAVCGRNRLRTHSRARKAGRSRTLRLPVAPAAPRRPVRAPSIRDRLSSSSRTSMSS